jgi:hypothetical protein
MYPSLNPRGTVVYSKDAPAFTVEKLEELKQKTKVGSMIKFKTTVLEDGTGHFIKSEVCGCVMEKYPHIFKLHDGRYYKWVDYLIGFIY